MFSEEDLMTRARFISNKWIRDPDGAELPREPPSGKRAPNGMMWGEDTDSFFVTERYPGKRVDCVWSRTMIQEFGENYLMQPEIFVGDESKPSVIPPYPILVSPSKQSANADEILDTDGDTNSKGRQLLSCDEHISQPPSSSVPKVRIDELPKLEEFIPDEHFPDLLMVHDPDDLTPGDHGSSRWYSSTMTRSAAVTVKYRRVYPKLDPKLKRKRQKIAHLHLAAYQKLGVGHHSLVYRAALQLPPPLFARESPNGQVSVAAKLAFPVRSARDLLAQEGHIYDKMPEHMMQDYNGMNIVPPIKYPVPVHAVVPKFYGYYVPVSDDKRRDSNTIDRSPILLVEECGEPVDSVQLRPDDQSECYSLILRLHAENILQNSVYVRNIMIQPGPLSELPQFRTLNDPSFRIIDFGRGERFEDWVGQHPDTDDKLCERWSLKKSALEDEVRSELLVEF